MPAPVRRSVNSRLEALLDVVGGVDRRPAERNEYRRGYAGSYYEVRGGWGG